MGEVIRYAGIGSRKRPDNVGRVFRLIGAELAQNDFVLHSGHADGCDSDFEIGCSYRNRVLMKIFLPWQGFNGSNSAYILNTYSDIGKKAMDFAMKYHPNWDNCSNAAKKLHARNGFQLLGEDLNTPVEFVLCYTQRGLIKGGTGQALRIAKDYNIMVINAGTYRDVISFIEAVEKTVGFEFKFKKRCDADFLVSAIE